MDHHSVLYPGHGPTQPAEPVQRYPSSETPQSTGTASTWWALWLIRVMLVGYHETDSRLNALDGNICYAFVWLPGGCEHVVVTTPRFSRRWLSWEGPANTSPAPTFCRASRASLVTVSSPLNPLQYPLSSQYAPIAHFIRQSFRRISPIWSTTSLCTTLVSTFQTWPWWARKITPENHGELHTPSRCRSETAQENGWGLGVVIGWFRNGVTMAFRFCWDSTDWIHCWRR
jgi:hypothetical protein